jgi:hypothetical protein
MVEFGYRCLIDGQVWLSMSYWWSSLPIDVLLMHRCWHRCFASLGFGYRCLIDGRVCLSMSYWCIDVGIDVLQGLDLAIDVLLMVCFAYRCLVDVDNWPSMHYWWWTLAIDVLLMFQHYFLQFVNVRYLDILSNRQTYIPYKFGDPQGATPPSPTGVVASHPSK